MALLLRANTAVDVLIGPFVDETDGKTAETALTLSQGDIKLSKNGQALAQKNDDTAAAADANGYYNCELDATDTNTEGTLVLIVHESGALPVRHEFMVMAEAAWDSMFVAKDDGYMDVNVKAVSEDTTAADNLESACDNYSATRGLAGTALPAAAADAAGGLPISDAGSLDLDAKLAATNEITAARMGALTDWINGGRLDLIIDAIAADVVNIDGAAMRGTDSAALASVLGAAVGASISADIAAVKAETAAIVADTNELQTDDYPTSIAAIKSVVDDILLDTGTTLDGKIDTIDGIVDAILIDTATIGNQGEGLIALPWNAAWDAEVQSECTDALNAYDPPTKAELDTAVANVSVDEIQATALADLFNTDSATTYAAAVAGSVVKEVADNAGGSALTTDAICEAMFTFDATATYATADAGSVVKQIADNAGGSALTEGGIADAVWDELQSGHVGAGTFGEIASEIATIAVDVAGLDGDAMRGTDSAALASVLGAAVGASISADIAAVKSDTAAILTDTGTTLDTLIKDIPTTAEFEARTLPAADYTVVADLGVVQTGDSFAIVNGDHGLVSIQDDIDAILTDTGTTLDGKLNTAQADLDILTGADGATLATLQANYAPSTHSAADVKTAIEAAGSHLALIKAVTDALTAAAAAKLATSAGTIVAGTVSHDNVAATTTVFYCDDITEATADHYNGRIIIFTSGALQYQATAIEDYELFGGESKFTVTALTEAPADNITFIIV